MQAPKLLLAVTLVCVCSLPSTSFAQPSAAPALTSSTITLDIAVADKANVPVKGLTQQSLTLLDNKKPLNVLAFQEVSGVTPQSPAEALVLIDGISTPLSRIAALRDQLIAFLRTSGNRLPLPVSFAFLTDAGLKTQEEPTSDTKLLIENLQNNPLPQQVHAITHDFQVEVELRQKSLEALDLLASRLSHMPGRKLLIWVSPGWESFESQTARKSSKEMQQLFTYIAGISTVLRRAGITLYAVDPTGASGVSRIRNSQYGSFLKGASSANDADNAHLMLPVLATQSGGLVLYGNNDIAALIGECLADASHYYEVTVQTPVPAHSAEAHHITVKLSEKHWKARTRTLYYALP